jgi:hypothetical protein
MDGVQSKEQLRSWLAPFDMVWLAALLLIEQPRICLGVQPCFSCPV